MPRRAGGMGGHPQADPEELTASRCEQRKEAWQRARRGLAKRPE